MSLTITSTAFVHNSAIPKRHTCDGANVSSELAWSGAPPATKSLALIVYDPDAPDPADPKMTWVHWVLYNLPENSRGLQEAVAVINLPSGTLEGINDWHTTGYVGPCPPIGRHRYFFKLLSLDIVLPDLHEPTKPVLEQAVSGHIVGQAELMGTYQRQGR